VADGGREHAALDEAERELDGHGIRFGTVCAGRLPGCDL